MSIDSGTRRTYESAISAQGSKGFHVTFGIERDGYQSECFAALFTDSERFDEAIHDGMAGLDERSFSSKYKAYKI